MPTGSNGLQIPSQYGGFQPGTYNYGYGSNGYGLLNQPYGTSGWNSTPEQISAGGNQYSGYNVPSLNLPALNMGAGPQGPYASGLPTEFNSIYDTYGPGQRYNDYSGASDPDVAAAQGLTNELRAAATGRDSGVNYATDNAALQMYLARIGQKNALGSAIAGNQQGLNSEIGNVKANANASLDQGLKNTRQNYAARGLLYSGLREAGEEGVRGGVAAQEAGDIAGTNQDYANMKSAEQQAYGAVDLANAQQTLQMATQAANTVAQNNIARAQAYQQLGQGAGYAGGTIAGGLLAPSPAQNPTAGWNPQGLTEPDLGSEFNPSQSYLSPGSFSSENGYLQSGYGMPVGSFTGGGSSNGYNSGLLTGGGSN